MAEPCVNSSQSATPKRRWLQFWPVAGYLVACVAGFYAATSEYSWWTGGVTTAMLFGLGCFVSAVGGLSSRCWLRGIWTAVAIAATTVFCFMITESEISEVRNLAGFFITPIFVLGISLPTLFARTFWGWKLEYSSAEPSHHSSLGMEETLLGVGVVASFLIMLRVPQASWEMPIFEFYTNVGASFAVLGAVSVIATLPAVRGVFRGQSVIGRVMVPAAVLFGVAAGTLALLELANSGSDVLISAGVAGGTASCCCLGGLFALRYSGLRLNDRTQCREATAEEKIADRRVHRRWVAGTMVIAFIATTTLATMQSQRQNAESQYLKLMRQLEPSGGFVTLEQRRIVGIGLGRDADDESLDRLALYPDLQHLSLADSKISDAGVAKIAGLYPNLRLRALDLGGTDITSRSLQSILSMPSLTTLSLARTKLTIDDINRLATNGRGWFELNLSGMQLNDSDIEALNVSPTTLILRDNRISDASLAALGIKVHGRCDVSGNSIDGSGLVHLSAVSQLVLEDVPLTDASLAKLPGVGVAASKIAVRNTLLTDAALASLAAMRVTELQLGPGKITERGLANANLALSSIRVNNPAFTGTFLAGKWVRDLSYLDLSESGITDANLSNLSRISSLYCLSLANTNVTDAALPHIAKANPLIRLDLRNTRITAEGLANSDITCQRIYLGLDQFTPQEIRRIRATKSIAIGEEFPKTVFE